MGGWNGGGQVELTYNWTDDAGAGIDIEAARMDAQDEDMRGAIENCIAKDGQNSATANLPMSGYKHTGVGNASARDSYAAAGQVQDGAFIYVATVGGTANAITLTPSPAITAYAAGQTFRFVPGALNTGATTVNISGVGAKNVYFRGVALTGGELESGHVYEIVYDGTQFALQNVPLRVKWGTQITANDTLALEDSFKIIDCSHATVAIGVTVPPNSSVAFPIGTWIGLKRGGAAAVTAVAGAGVTLNSPGSALAIDEQYGVIFLVKESTDTWIVGGNL